MQDIKQLAIEATSYEAWLLAIKDITPRAYSLRTFQHYRKSAAVTGVKAQRVKSAAPAHQRSVTEKDFISALETEREKNRLAQNALTTLNARLAESKGLNEAKDALLEAQAAAHKQLNESYSDLEVENERLQREFVYYKGEYDRVTDTSEYNSRLFVWGLVTVIIVATFRSVWTGLNFDGQDWVTPLLLAVVFAAGGFCVMQIKSAARKVKIAAAGLCVTWEVVFTASAIFRKLCTTDASGAKKYSEIVTQAAQVTGASDGTIAGAISFALAATVGTLLYICINILAQKK